MSIHGRGQKIMEENMTETVGQWVSILDYARIKKTSISTIRRSIKAKHVTYKMEEGKYFILLRNANLDVGHNEDVQLLKKQLYKLQEENNELKMLVKLYEDKFNYNKIPEIPNLVL